MNNFSKLRELTFISNMGIERILELPFGIINKWETGELKMKAEDVALFKFLILFPWLLKVVEDGYTKEASLYNLLAAVNKKEIEDEI